MGNCIPGGNCRPPVNSDIRSAIIASTLGLGVVEGGDDEILEDLGIGRIDKRRVDLDPTRLGAAVQRHLTMPPPDDPVTSTVASCSCISLIFD